MARSEPMLDESYMRRIARLADTHPDRAAIIFASISGDEQTISWDALERWTNQIARMMAGPQAPSAARWS